MKKYDSYYRMTLYNPFEESDLKQDVIIVFSDIDERGLRSEARELLTGKKVLCCDVKSLREEDIVSGIIQQKYELMGDYLDKLNEEFVLKFLKFTPRENIDIIVNNIINIEESVKNYIKNNQNKGNKSKKISKI